jgi:hypothetical protein
VSLQPDPPKKRGRPPKASSGVLVVIAPDTASATRSTRSAAQSDVEAPSQTWMRNIKRQMQHMMQLLARNSADRARPSPAAAPAPDDDSDDDDSGDGSDVPQSHSPQSHSIPPSNLLVHIPRQSLDFWGTRAAGTPMSFKELPAQLRTATGKGERDRLEVAHIYTAFTISASLLDVLIAITHGERSYAQIRIELVHDHLIPMLCRCLDALQQEGALC